MSPLAEAIYHILSRRPGLAEPLISYTDLVKELPSLAPPYDNITRNDERLYNSLGEVGRACKEYGLPVVTALVIRAADRSPGPGYYQTFHPEAGDDPAKRLESWKEELKRVVSTTYPQTPGAASTTGTGGAGEDRRRSRPLGHLQVADAGSRPGVVFTGRITCPRCSTSFDVEIARNTNAVSPKQPAFLIEAAEASPNSAPLGYMFIGTILTSPVLYYGALNHCGPEQRLSIFYHRALRDRLDPHFDVMPSTSAEPNSTSEDGTYKLS